MFSHDLPAVRLPEGVSQRSRSDVPTGSPEEDLIGTFGRSRRDFGPAACGGTIRLLCGKSVQAPCPSGIEVVANPPDPLEKGIQLLRIALQLFQEVLRITTNFASLLIRI